MVPEEANAPESEVVDEEFEEFKDIVRVIISTAEQQCRAAEQRAENDQTGTIDPVSACDTIFEVVMEALPSDDQDRVAEVDLGTLAQQSPYADKTDQALRNPLRVNCTYAMSRPEFGSYKDDPRPYYGRNSWKEGGTCQQARATRYANHTVLRDDGYTKMEADEEATGTFGFAAIVGREQQLMDQDKHTDNGQVDPIDTERIRNAQRGVSKYNPEGCIFYQASNIRFGEKAPYTGHIPETFAAPFF